MPRQSAKTILEKAKEHVEEYGMDVFCVGYYDSPNLSRIPHCPRSLIRYVSGEIEKKDNSPFIKPTKTSSNKALKTLDKVAKKMGAEPRNSSPGDYAEGYSMKIGSNNREAAVKLFDEALKLI